jgi:transposase-like protein
MKNKTRRRFTAEFKAQAVELLQAGRPAAELAHELGIGLDLIYAWRRHGQGEQVRSEAAPAEGGSGAAEELLSLRREVALLRQENDILKKAAVILGTRPPSNCAK